MSVFHEASDRRTEGQPAKPSWQLPLTSAEPLPSKRVMIVGMGPGDARTMTVRARDALLACDMVVGSARLLSELPEGSCPKRVSAPLPADVMRAIDEAPAGARICAVMSGDVGLYSGARTLAGLLSQRDDLSYTCEPGVSTASLLAARLSMPWQDWVFASSHGVDCDPAALLCAHGKVFIVTDRNHDPAWICSQLSEAGCADGVEAFVGERLSYPDERVRRMPARDAAKASFDQPCVVLLVRNEGGGPRALAADANARNAGGEMDGAANPAEETDACRWRYATPGIPDDLFARKDGIPMTKQEIRAVALSKLRIAPADVLYDVGSGTGSVSVEMGRLASAGAVFGIDKRSDAIELTRQNVARFCLANVRCVQGEAPQCLSGLPAPDAAFIGGTAGSFQAIIAALLTANPEVRICATCVSLETLREALAVLDDPCWRDAEVCQVSVARAEKLGGSRLMRPLSPVFILSARGAGKGALA